MGYLEKKIGFCTDPGNGPRHNEDAVVCFSNPKESSEIEMLVGVADGLGQYAGGDIASSFLTEKLSAWFRGREYQSFARKAGVDPRNFPLLFKLILQQLNSELFQKRSKDPEHPNMGSTFTGGLAYEMDLYLAHVGDSRAYRVRGGKISNLTADHTLGAKLGRAGLGPETLPAVLRNSLYRSFGYRPWIKIDFQILQVLPNDFYCFLTDGCHGVLKEDEILRVIRKEEYDPGGISRALVQCAREKGSRDNLSAAGILYVNYMGLEMTKQDATGRLELR